MQRQAKIIELKTISILCLGLLTFLPQFSQAENAKLSLHSHHTRCGTRDVTYTEQNAVAQVINQVELLGGELAKLSGQDDLGAYAQQRAVIVPVVVHVLAQGSGLLSGEVPQSKIYEQIEILNRAYSGQAGGSSSGFQFVLQDITYSYNPDWATMTYGSRAEAEAKSTLRQGDERTLNVYFADLDDGVLGWSTFPWEYAKKPAMDGVVINYHSLPGGGTDVYSEGDTLVHEAGHWFGLFHTFEGGCSKKGDSVSDTAAEKYPALGCPVRRNTCKGKPGTDAVHNYMNYVDDACMNEFTKGQARRMYALMAAYR